MSVGGVAHRVDHSQSEPRQRERALTDLAAELAHRVRVDVPVREDPLGIAHQQPDAVDAVRLREQEPLFLEEPRRQLSRQVLRRADLVLLAEPWHRARARRALPRRGRRRPHVARAPCAAGRRARVFATAAGAAFAGAAGLVVTGAAGLVATGAAGLRRHRCSGLGRHRCRGLGHRRGVGPGGCAARCCGALRVRPHALRCGVPGAVRAFAGGVLAGVSTAPLAGRDVCPCERRLPTRASSRHASSALSRLAVPWAGRPGRASARHGLGRFRLGRPRSAFATKPAPASRRGSRGRSPSGRRRRGSSCSRRRSEWSGRLRPSPCPRQRWPSKEPSFCCWPWRSVYPRCPGRAERSAAAVSGRRGRTQANGLDSAGRPPLRRRFTASPRERSSARGRVDTGRRQRIPAAPGRSSAHDTSNAAPGPTARAPRPRAGSAPAAAAVGGRSRSRGVPVRLVERTQAEIARAATQRRTAAVKRQPGHEQGRAAREPHRIPVARGLARQDAANCAAPRRPSVAAAARAPVSRRARQGTASSSAQRPDHRQPMAVGVLQHVAREQCGPLAGTGEGAEERRRVVAVAVHELRLESPGGADPQPPAEQERRAGAEPAARPDQAGGDEEQRRDRHQEATRRIEAATPHVPRAGHRQHGSDSGERRSGPVGGRGAAAGRGRAGRGPGRASRRAGRTPGPAAGPAGPRPASTRRTRGACRTRAAGPRSRRAAGGRPRSRRPRRAPGQQGEPPCATRRWRQSAWPTASSASGA